MSRRQKLIWFAAGAGVSSVIWLVAHLSLNYTYSHEGTVFLVLEEPQSASVDKIEESELIANRTGRFVRDCGTEYFISELGYPEQSPSTLVPLIEMNFNSLECIYGTAEAEGIVLSLTHRWGDARVDYSNAKQAFLSETFGKTAE